jgi:seryl-tRNA synthetase
VTAPADPPGAHGHALAEAGLLSPAGAAGLYGRSGLFERLVTGIEGLVARAAAQEGATVMRFPPVMPVWVLERTGYVGSFPDLVGVVHSFQGGDSEHRQLREHLEAGGEWTSGLGPTGTALCSAACHPLYPCIDRQLPAGGRRWDVYGWVFRHEPSTDPARMQAFRQYEVVFVGEPGGAVGHRNKWVQWALDLTGRLGLEAYSEPANDPFFGRSGRMLAASQRQLGLKYEVRCATGPGEPEAVASANYHVDHFGTAFGLQAANGDAAHSACFGLGVERLTLALLHAHGLRPAAWPAGVRALLGC